MSQVQEVVIIGAGYAGLMAAQRLAHLTHSAEVHITLVNAADHFVERVRLHQIANGQAIRSYRIADLINSKRIAFVQAKVTAIDPVQKDVHLKGSGEPQRIPYDKLV